MSNNPNPVNLSESPSSKPDKAPSKDFNFILAHQVFTRRRNEASDVIRANAKTSPIMSTQTEASPQEQPQLTAESASVYNPLEHGVNTIGNSVVSDLMSVYENMTQSSTPQPVPSHAPQQAPQSDYESHQSQSYHQHPDEASTMQHQYQEYVPQQHHHVQYSHPPPPQKTYYGEQSSTYYPQSYGAPPAHTYTHDMNPMVQMQQPGEEVESESDEIERTSRSRKKRGSSGRGSKGRKKSKPSDGRWSKRFTWPDELHRDFVSAIFDVGLKHSSPSTIIEHMPKHPDITTERIKSHLQKYRVNRSKSKQEFMSSYESSLLRFQESGTFGLNSITGAQVAAQLTYADTKVEQPSSGEEKTESLAADPSQVLTYSPQVNEALMLPQLTPAEKNSPIGASMGYLMGLFFTLKQQLAAQRTRDAGKAVSMNKVPTNGVAPPTISGTVAAVDSESQQDVDDGTGASRTNMETSFMKREMKNQMALQNKMRALKQQELNKYEGAKHKNDIKGSYASKEEYRSTEDNEEKLEASEVTASQGGGQLTGHAGTSEGQDRARGLSVGNSEDFWSTDVVDENLFEFLLNN